MKLSKWVGAIPVFVSLSGCMGGLGPALKRDISDEHQRLQEAERSIQQSQGAIARDQARDPDLFGHAPAPAAWTTQLQAARETLGTAAETDRDLNSIAGRNSPEQQGEAERLLKKEKTLRRSAVDEAQAAVASADKWVTFKRDLAGHLGEMKREYDAVRATDFHALTEAVERAEQDWPAKKEALASRLAAVIEIPKKAEVDWNRTAAIREKAAGEKVSGAELATLIAEDEELAGNPGAIEAKSGELRQLRGQLYDSWDKILVDLEHREGGDEAYRERIRTVRTHITDAAAKQSETSSFEQWTPVSEAAFHAIANDLGMAIAHKDAGLFDSEAVNTPQPAGFAYIAPEAQGSNQYGYWAHDGGGASVWTWLPQYLILRELLWNHSYRPVILNEYRGYRMAESAGRTYYGKATPASAPTYGTHGTFTRTTYGNSRYAQAGGFKGSAYASREAGRSPSAFRPANPEEHRSPALAERGAGKRFGFGAGAPSGKRFGQSGGGRSFGRGFGRRR